MSQQAHGMNTANNVKVLDGAQPVTFTEILEQGTEPVLLRGLVADWPVVQAARESHVAVDSYLRRHYQGATVNVFSGAPEIGGRFFYNESMTGLNFNRSREKLDAVLDSLNHHRESTAAPAFYVGATTVDKCLPGFRAENPLDFGDIGLGPKCAGIM